MERQDHCSHGTQESHRLIRRYRTLIAGSSTKIKEGVSAPLHGHGSLWCHRNLVARYGEPLGKKSSECDQKSVPLARFVVMGSAYGQFFVARVFTNYRPVMTLSVEAPR